MVDMLLDAGAAIEAAEGWPLQTAAGEGHEDVVKELISRGANVNAYTTDERFPQGTALQAATEAGKVEIVKLLLEEHNADPDLGAGDLTCPIIAAARKGEGEILELIVERKAKVDLFGGPDSSTPLINAAMFMPKQYLKLLLDAGADINLADTDGDTALIMTALRGDAESVEFLLQNGADCMAVSKSRNINALQAAYEGEDRRCLQLLIDHVSKLLRSSKSGENGDGGDQDIEADSEATDHEDHESDDGAGDEEPDEEVEEEVEEEDEE
jgi:ankyrin repeat protein